MNKMQYSASSRRRLATCHYLLQYVFAAALETGLIDITILQGRRDKAEQDRLFRLGKSKLKWPKSRHNVSDPDQRSMAVDAAPFVNGQVSWKKEHCIFLAGVVLSEARRMNVDLRWGGNWDMDGEPVTDQDFQDLVHYELIGQGL